jgi:hypothetical protein
MESNALSGNMGLNAAEQRAASNTCPEKEQVRQACQQFLSMTSAARS